MLPRRRSSVFALDVWQLAQPRLLPHGAELGGLVVGGVLDENGEDSCGFRCAMIIVTFVEGLNGLDQPATGRQEVAAQCGHDAQLAVRAGRPVFVADALLDLQRLFVPALRLFGVPPFLGEGAQLVVRDRRARLVADALLDLPA